MHILLYSCIVSSVFWWNYKLSGVSCSPQWRSEMHRGMRPCRPLWYLSFIRVSFAVHTIDKKRYCVKCLWRIKRAAPRGLHPILLYHCCVVLFMPYVPILELFLYCSIVYLYAEFLNINSMDYGTWRFNAAFESCVLKVLLTPCLMVTGGSIQHLQGISNNPYPESNQPNSSYWCLFV